MATPVGFENEAAGGINSMMALAAAAFAALLLATMAGGTSSASSNAGPAQTYQYHGYFPDGYVNQATTIELPIATF